MKSEKTCPYCDSVLDCVDIYAKAYACGYAAGRAKERKDFQTQLATSEAANEHMREQVQRLSDAESIVSNELTASKEREALLLEEIAQLCGYDSYAEQCKALGEAGTSNQAPTTPEGENV